MKTKFVSQEALLSMAVAGILAGTISTGCTTKEEPKPAAPAASAPKEGASSATTPAKHSCKGLNACKGQGGCKTGDNGCTAKNSCKGKGGCEVPAKH